MFTLPRFFKDKPTVVRISAMYPDRDPDSHFNHILPEIVGETKHCNTDHTALKTETNTKLQLQRPVGSSESTPGQSRVSGGPTKYKKRNIMDELMPKSVSRYLRKRLPPKEMPQTNKKPKLISSDSDSDEALRTDEPSTAF
ncbi:hypothetical protein QAD02_020499 [Eretmocerus hayati]|uniref:Uncharacterized protein n=2 Tax=Eretmocerus hayati TaxID=131215 RepID=A0ACC2NI51_9HYME|nr:hypothetical protein QAD02_001186 [Eretmocerus hayati]KAJ8684706.1 hypothetical protein QAD02_020499 [Eretmocerus hayati]